MKLRKSRSLKQPAEQGDSSSPQAANGLAGFLPSSWQRGWLFGLFLVAVTMIAYLPVWHAGFIWDDDYYVTSNTALRSWEGLRQIWLVPGATVQYYPLTFTSFWLEYHLWGLHPLGYHLVNVLLHSCNAMLFWLILRRLRVPGAWLAAAIFALHPVSVQSVAWVTERKNTLSGLYYLGAILAALKFWLPGTTSLTVCQKEAESSTIGFGNWKWYWLAFALYVCALWSKTTTVPLPVVIILLVWRMQGRLHWRWVYPLLPFLALGVGMGLVTMHIEKHLGAAGSGWNLSLLQRCLIAGHAFWFYLGKLFWPHPLIFVYDRWTLDPSRVSAYLPILAVMAGLLILWLKRGGWGRPVFFALAYFLVSLFLVLGFFNIYYFRYAYVSDHFQYLASLGPITLAAAGISTAFGFVRVRRPLLELMLCSILLLVLGGLTWRQCRTYVDGETLWRTTIAQNPGSWMAHNNLGYLLLHQGRLVEALTHLRNAVELEPDDATVQDNLGSALLAEGEKDEAFARFREALKVQPDYAPAVNNIGNVLLEEGRTDEAISYFRKALTLQPGLAEACYDLGNAFLQKGDLDAAIRQWQKTLKIQPDYALAHNNLGNAMLQQGELDPAIRQFQLALKSQPDMVDAQNNLASALLQKGRLNEAIEHWQDALALRPDFVPAQNNLAWVLATCPLERLRNGPKAIELAEQANRQSGGQNLVILRTLAATYAEGGRFTEAVEMARQALQLATEQHNTGLADSLQQQIGLYQMGMPFRENNQTNIPSAQSNSAPTQKEDANH